ncbi:MAG: hemolysin III family protein [Bacilli bacterium]|nr:hemolysin III family protein [Bacilli bacterium]
MKLEEYLETHLQLKKGTGKKILTCIDSFKKERNQNRLKKISIPNYTLGEELFNSISHGIGAVFSVVALILMIVKARGALAETCVSLFGSTMIILYTISCVYHGLSSRLLGKKVLRVLDHCNVYLLVFGTYIPMALLGISGIEGWIFFSVVGLVTIVGIVLSCIDIERFQLLEVVCHLGNGWAALFAIPSLLNTIGGEGLFYLILGGVMYSVGSILYGIGKHKKYMHCVFHIFCLLGTLFHFMVVYIYLL